MTFYDFIYLAMKKNMMNNRFGFKELIVQFDNAANTIIKLNKDDEDVKNQKKNKNALPKKP